MSVPFFAVLVPMISGQLVIASASQWILESLPPPLLARAPCLCRLAEGGPGPYVDELTWLQRVQADIEAHDDWLRGFMDSGDGATLWEASQRADKVTQSARAHTCQVGHFFRLWAVPISVVPVPCQPATGVEGNLLSALFQVLSLNPGNSSGKVSSAVGRALRQYVTAADSWLLQF